MDSHRGYNISFYTNNAANNFLSLVIGIIIKEIKGKQMTFDSDYQ
jgi:hypothetical protein